ncbi:folate family ECF transporter S component [Lacticaseibacillus nasuensis]|uniref:folate family ECF transporter S component n=1 Tax=Lacticaseibacillus nasuensis TaxID=944671 RepID=UPI00224757C5|nr:folate family ECF transporter S component [Lacticaseibacillus nasuensis]MCX2454463.1 folate family ECF transporter S component [Lacticaseibacillus nasuensis]
MVSLSFSSPRVTTRTTVVMAMLVAMSVVLERFSFGTTWLQIGPGIFATLLMAYYLGPWLGAVAAAIADQLSTILSGGPNFLGFTLSAALAVMIYGIFLHEQPVTVWRILLATILVVGIVYTVLNTLWVVMLGASWSTILIPRAIKELATLPIQAGLAYVTLKAVAQIKPHLA